MNWKFTTHVSLSFLLFYITQKRWSIFNLLFNAKWIFLLSTRSSFVEWFVCEKVIKDRIAEPSSSSSSHVLMKFNFQFLFEITNDLRITRNERTQHFTHSHAFKPAIMMIKVSSAISNRQKETTTSLWKPSISRSRFTSHLVHIQRTLPVCRKTNLCFHVAPYLADYHHRLIL